MPSPSPAPPESRCRQAVPRRHHRGLIPVAVADDGACTRDPLCGAQCRRLGWPPFGRAAGSASPVPKFPGRMSASTCATSRRGLAAIPCRTAAAMLSETRTPLRAPSPAQDARTGQWSQPAYAREARTDCETVAATRLDMTANLRQRSTPNPGPAGAAAGSPRQAWSVAPSCHGLVCPFPGAAAQRKRARLTE